MTKGDTKNAKEAAEQIISTVPFEDLQRELASEGVYHVIVEGGYHQKALTDNEATFLTELLIEDGVSGLEDYVDSS